MWGGGDLNLPRGDGNDVKWVEWRHCVARFDCPVCFLGVPGILSKLMQERKKDVGRQDLIAVHRAVGGFTTWHRNASSRR